MKDFYAQMQPKKIDFITRFKRFMDKRERRPTPDEIREAPEFCGFSVEYVYEKIGRLKTIENRIRKGIY